MEEREQSGLVCVCVGGGVGVCGGLQEKKTKRTYGFWIVAEKVKSLVAKHTWKKDHTLLWEDWALFAPVSNYYSRKVREYVETLIETSVTPKKGKPVSEIWSTPFRH